MATFVNVISRRASGAPLGRGVFYPFRRSVTGGVQMVEGEGLIQCSIRFLLLENPEEHPYDEQEGVGLGVGIDQFLFEDVQQVQEVLGYRVRRVLEVWEPRIEVLSVDVSAQGQSVWITVRYMIVSTTQTSSVVVEAPMRMRER